MDHPHGQPSQKGPPEIGNPQRSPPTKVTHTRNLLRFSKEKVHYPHHDINQEVCQITLINTDLHEARKITSQNILPIRCPLEIPIHHPRARILEPTLITVEVTIATGATVTLFKSSHGLNRVHILWTSKLLCRHRWIAACFF